MTLLLLLLLLLPLLVPSIICQSTAPLAQIRLLSPRGFEISVPADVGTALFGFHGKLNEPMVSGEAGRWSHDVSEVSDGRLAYRVEDVTLKPGDVINYWTYINHEGNDYYSELSSFTIAKDADGTLTSRSLQPESADTTPPQSELQSVTLTSSIRPKPPPGNCTHSLTRVQDPIERIPCARELIFEDNFTDRLDRRLWRVEQRFSAQPDYEFNMYMDRPETVVVRGNLLVLNVHRLGNDFNVSAVDFGLNCTGRRSSDECEAPEHLSTLFTPPIAAGQLSTVRSFSFQYGRVEVRAKLPYANWIFPQVQLQPAEQAYGTEKLQSGLMRLAWGTPREDLYAGVLLAPGWPHRELGVCRRRGSEPQWSRGFHEYTMDWRPDGISFAFDGTVICRIDSQTMQRRAANGRMAPSARKWQRYRATPMAPYDRLFYLQLGVGVAGFNDFSDEPDRYRAPKPWRNNEYHAKLSFWDVIGAETVEDWPGTMGDLMVDWIRVYAL